MVAVFVVAIILSRLHETLKRLQKRLGGLESRLENGASDQFRPKTNRQEQPA
jgi:hypothetical protein